MKSGSCFFAVAASGDSATITVKPTPPWPKLHSLPLPSIVEALGWGAFEPDNADTSAGVTSVQGSTAVGTAVAPASASDAEGRAASEGGADPEAPGGALGRRRVERGRGGRDRVRGGVVLPLAVDAEQAARPHGGQDGEGGDRADRAGVGDDSSDGSSMVGAW